MRRLLIAGIYSGGALSGMSVAGALPDLILWAGLIGAVICDQALAILDRIKP